MYGLRETVWCNSTLALPTPRSEMRQKFVVAKYRKFSPGAYMIFQRPLLRKFLLRGLYTEEKLRYKIS